MSADSNAHSEIGRDVVRDRNALQAEQRGILIRLLTDLVDLPTLLTFGSGVNKARLTFIFVCFYYIPAVVALRYLWQQIASVRAGE